MIFRFLNFELDLALQELREAGAARAIEPQVFELLRYLIENRERVVSRDEIFENIWHGRIVSEATLDSRMKAARRAVGDSGRDQRIIQTLPRRGFRFIAELEAVDRLSPSAGAVAGFIPSEKPSIAILPFKNMSADPGQEYFADGMSEDLITALSRVRWLLVISRNTSFSYKGSSPDVREVARELGVRYVLEGSFRKSENRIRVTVQLVDGHVGGNIWAERYDRDLKDIFAVQDEIARTIAGALEPELGRAEQRRVSALPPENLQTWELYQRGMSRLHLRTREDLEAAQALFAAAIEKDGCFAPALSASAEAHFIQIVEGFAADPEQSQTAATDLARRAVALDPQDAYAHYALGRSFLIRNLHYDAVPELEQAIALNPSFAWAYYALGMAFNTTGRPNDAAAQIEMALRLSPHDPYRGRFLMHIGESHLMAGDYDSAVEWLLRSMREPNVRWSNYAVLIVTYSFMGRVEDAANMIRAMREFRPDIDLAFMKARWPIGDAAARARVFEGLDKAWTAFAGTHRAHTVPSSLS